MSEATPKYWQPKFTTGTVDIVPQGSDGSVVLARLPVRLGGGDVTKRRAYLRAAAPVLADALAALLGSMREPNQMLSYEYRKALEALRLARIPEER